MMKVLNSIRWFFGLLLPMFARSRDVRGMSPTWRWIIHITLFVILLVALTLIFNLTGLRTLISPGGTGWVRATWPSLLVLALYTLCWIGWWIYQILMEPPPVSQFPDIDAAWEDALRALDSAGIDLTEAPLFLIIGRPEASEEGLFEASQISLTVNFAPRRTDAPLHVYAQREGIYLTCAGASTLGHQAALLAGEAQLPSSGGRAGASRYDDDRSFGGETFGGQTNDPREIDKWMKVKDVINRARAQGRGPSELTPEERRELEVLEEKAGGGVATERNRPLLHQNSAVVENYAARFRHLCRLVVRDRRPFCPVNGMLILLPLAATDSDELAGEVGACIQDDLAIARAELRVNCPVFTVMSDLEKVPGYVELTTRLPKQALSQRVGQRFPFAPEVAPEEIPGHIEGAVRHIGDSFFPNLVSTLWRIEDTPQLESAVTHDNVQLFRFLSDIRERQRRLARINARALARDLSDGPLMFGGCYLAGTKRGGGVNPAFVRGIFQRLAKHQEDVSWNRAALADDSKSERVATIGYSLLALLVGAFILVGVLLFSGALSIPSGTGDESTADSTK
jgi:IcmF-related N-terminal domain